MLAAYLFAVVTTGDNMVAVKKPRRNKPIRQTGDESLRLFEDLPAEPITFETFLKPNPPLLVPAYGAGRDSTALLILLKRRGIRPDLILFADTGSEKKLTYDYLLIMNGWLASVGFPLITLVKKRSPKCGDTSLYAECIRKKMLPSIAYGHHSCSEKWKQSPQEIYLNHWGPAFLSWRRGRKVIRAIGYESTECNRVERATTYLKKKPSKKFDYWYPLVEAGLNLDACIELIESEGLPVPIKSACFFCSGSKKPEIEWLSREDPEQFQQALVLEETAQATNRKVKGLGRSFAWRDQPCAYSFGV